MKEEQILDIKNLYAKGLSVREIAENFSVSIHAMYYIFRKYAIKRRNPSERNNVFFQRKKTSYIIKSDLSEKEQQLKVAGIMLYWGEGSQWSGEKIVDFANSKPEMIKIFLLFLRNVCGINEKKLRVFLYAYSNQNIKEVLNFWSNITNIPLKQFTRPYIQKSFQKEKKDKMKYGLVHIRYYDKKLLLQILDWIQQYQLGWVPERSNGADCQ